MACDDFRGIAIDLTPVLCKVFEHCFLDLFQSLLSTGDNQFGFKKGTGCSHSSHTLLTLAVLGIFVHLIS